MTTNSEDPPSYFSTPAVGHGFSTKFSDDDIRVAAVPANRVDDAYITNDFRSLVRISTARIACFDFVRPLSLELSASEFVEELYSIPSKFMDGSVSFALGSSYATLDEVFGRSLAELLPRDLGYDSLFERWHQNAFSGQSFETSVLATDLTPLVLQSVVYARLHGETFTRLWVVLRDVTVHARAVQALAQAELHYRSLVERPGLILVRVRPDATLDYVSPSLEQMLGWSLKELNHSEGLVRDLVHPEDSARYESIRGARSVRSNATVETELRLRLKNGLFHWFLVRQTPKLFPGGEVEYFDVIAIDIQTHKELEAEVERASRVALVGQLASGIAHDFNNHLTAILGQLDSGLASLEPRGAAYGAFDAARQAVASCSHMTRQLLDVGKGSASALSEIPLREAVMDGVMLVRHLLPSAVELTVAEIDHDADLRVRGDSVQIQQVVINLILNARDALPNGGSITVSVTRPPASSEGDTHTSVKRGEYACISVSDDGTGIPEDLAGQIFEPFFTTKGSRGGSGLGLSMVKTIAEAHHGWVSLQNRSEGGSTFNVFLPLTNEVAPYGDLSRRASLPIAEAGSIRPQTVVVAEDDEAVRCTLINNLARLGYQVKAFPDATSCINYLNSPDHACDTVILDESMPGLRGTEALSSVKRIRPGLHIVLTSGDSSVGFHQNVRRNGVSFLAKPFQIGELVALLGSQGSWPKGNA